MQPINVNLEVIITTKVTGSIIEQEVETKHFPYSDFELLSKEILDIREQKVREALVALGWKPPEGE